MNKEELYDALVELCQQVGFTTESTYEHLHSAVDSILDDEEL
jgi:regulator of replication initiation timing